LLFLKYARLVALVAFQAHVRKSPWVSSAVETGAFVSEMLIVMTCLARMFVVLVQYASDPYVSVHGKRGMKDFTRPSAKNCVIFQMELTTA